MNPQYVARSTIANMRSMHEPDAVGPALEDAKALIERLSPQDRAMLRPWVLARFSVSGDLHADIQDRERDVEPDHRLRR